jgi:hypothetical protein
MTSGDFAFATLAANPIGGLLVAIPFGVLKQHYPLWRVVLTGVPLAYLQVFVVDLAWSVFIRAAWWQRFLDRRRSKTVERLIASKGGFWITFFACPVLGPWAVMAFMRYAQVPHRRVALPMALSLLCFAAALSALCIYAPRMFAS